MGVCKFCLTPAGFLRGQHRSCLAKHQGARREAEDILLAGSSGQMDPSEALGRARQLCTDGWVQGIEQLQRRAWSAAVSQAFDDGLLTEEEDARLLDALNAYGIRADEVLQAWTQRCQGCVIRSVVSGEIPGDMGIDFKVPIVLQKGEVVIWAWGNVRQFQERTRTTFQGAGQGVSFKVAKGVYYRASAFKGAPVVTTHQVPMGSGVLVFTQKNLYWGGGDGKALRIPWGKILAVQGFSDAVGIQRDGASAKPMTFLVGPGQGWAAKNLAENIPHLGA